MQARVEVFLTGLPHFEGAACRGQDPNIFFPQRWEPAKVARARAVCDTCSICDECLTYALDHSRATSMGIWGGTTEKQRRVLRAARRVAS